MKLMGPMIVVADMGTARRFYEGLLGEQLRFDLGARQQFESGLELQSRNAMADIFSPEKEQAVNGSQSLLLYYETEEFDRFLPKLKEAGTAYLHGKSEPEEFAWGQRYIRFYDPDGHIIQVAESMGDVIRRFFAQGLTAEDIVACTDFPLEYVAECLR